MQRKKAWRASRAELNGSIMGYDHGEAGPSAASAGCASQAPETPARPRRLESTFDDAFTLPSPRPCPSPFLEPKQLSRRLSQPRRLPRSLPVSSPPLTPQPAWRLSGDVFRRVERPSVSPRRPSRSPQPAAEVSTQEVEDVYPPSTRGTALSQRSGAPVMLQRQDAARDEGRSAQPLFSVGASRLPGMGVGASAGFANAFGNDLFGTFQDGPATHDSVLAAAGFTVICNGLFEPSATNSLAQLTPPRPRPPPAVAPANADTRSGARGYSFTASCRTSTPSSRACGYTADLSELKGFKVVQCAAFERVPFKKAGVGLFARLAARRAARAASSAAAAAAAGTGNAAVSRVELARQRREAWLALVARRVEERRRGQAQRRAAAVAEAEAALQQRAARKMTKMCARVAAKPLRTAPSAKRPRLTTQDTHSMRVRDWRGSTACSEVPSYLRPTSSFLARAQANQRPVAQPLEEDAC